MNKNYKERILTWIDNELETNEDFPKIWLNLTEDEKETFIKNKIFDPNNKINKEIENIIESLDKIIKDIKRESYLQRLDTEICLSKYIPISGIYRITNTKNEKIYIGKSKNIITRFYSHTNDLLSGKHVNKELLNDYNYFGLNSFKPEIIELCHNNILLKKESYYITKYFNEGYNLYNIKNKDGSPIVFKYK